MCFALKIWGKASLLDSTEKSHNAGNNILKGNNFPIGKKPVGHTL
jgi:hypothetical protein